MSISTTDPPRYESKRYEIERLMLGTSWLGDHGGLGGQPPKPEPVIDVTIRVRDRAA